MHWTIFASPTELAVTALAVVLVGLSKGGLGGMSLLGVPLMALVMPPVTAAAILLPVLVVSVPFVLRIYTITHEGADRELRLLAGMTAVTLFLSGTLQLAGGLSSLALSAWPSPARL